MPEFALIACRVTSETKARVRRLAERDGITESTLVRQLLDVVLRTAGLDDPRPMAVPEKVNRDARLNVRLEPEDWRLLRERARARGMASATYLSISPGATYAALRRSQRWNTRFSGSPWSSSLPSGGTSIRSRAR